MQEAEPFLRTLHRWMEVFMQRSMRDFSRYARERGLSMSQIGALFQVRRRGTCTVGDLGESLGITTSAASQLVDRIVQQGLMQRSEDPSDRRVRQIALTAGGQEVLQGGIRARERWLADLADTLTASEKEAVVVTLNTLIDRAARLGQPAESEAETFSGGTSPHV